MRFEINVIDGYISDNTVHKKEILKVDFYSKTTAEHAFDKSMGNDLPGVYTCAGNMPEDKMTLIAAIQASVNKLLRHSELKLKNKKD